MAAQNLVAIFELSGGSPTGEMRSGKSTDDFTFPFATSAFTNVAGFAAGLTVGAAQSIAGEGALDLLTGAAGDLTLRSQAGDVIVRLGDASGSKKLSVRDSGGTETAYFDSDGNLVVVALTVSGALTHNGATFTSTAATEVHSDNLIQLNAGPGAAARDGGLLIERYAPNNDLALGDLLSDTPLLSNTAQSGGTTTSLVLNSGASSSDDAYNNGRLSLIGSHILASQVRKVTDYDGTTKVATVAAWTAKNATGTVSVANGVATVTGVGTAFTTELAVGDTIVIGGITKAVASIASDTSLDADSTYGGAQAGATLSVTAPGQVGFKLYDLPYVGLVYDESADWFALIGTLDDPSVTAITRFQSYMPLRSGKVTTTEIASADGAVDLLLSASAAGIQARMGSGTKFSFRDGATEYAYINSAGTASFVGLIIGAAATITDIDTDLSGVSTNHDTLPSALAVKTYVDSQIGTVDELNDLTDVIITAAAANDFLVFDGATWVDMAAADAAEAMGVGVTDSPSFAGLDLNGNAVLSSAAEVQVEGYTAASSDPAANNLLFVMVNDTGMKARLPDVTSGTGSFALARVNGVWRTGGKAVRHDHCETLLVEDGVSVSINDAIYASTTTAGRVTISGGTGFPAAGAFKVLVGYAKSVVAGGTDQTVKIDLLIQPPVQL